MNRSEWEVWDDDAGKWVDEGDDLVVGPSQPVAVMDKDLAHILILAAEGHRSLSCRNRPCERCERQEARWDELLNRLPAQIRKAAIRAMLEMGITYPGLEV